MMASRVFHRFFRNPTNESATSKQLAKSIVECCAPFLDEPSLLLLGVSASGMV
jgi:hypothetical protein